MSIEVEVFSDVICPWCFVGKRRLETALRAMEGRGAIRVTWRPFELNPDMPRAGMDRRAYRERKFSSWEASQALDARVAAVGAAEGIDFAFQRMLRTPNTLDAHRLIWLAQQQGAQDAIVGALFHVYFIEGRDIGDRDVLVEIAGASGLEKQAVRDFLEGDEGIAAVRDEEARAHRLGIRAVPTFVLNGESVVSGAQEAETLLAAFERATGSPSHR